MVAQTIINPTQKVGRNDACPCGSNKKYKFCCGANGGLPKSKPGIQLTQVGLDRCYLLMVKGMGGTLSIPCEEIDKLDNDEVLVYSHNQKAGTIEFKSVKVKVSKILQPGGKKVEVVEEEEDRNEVS